MAGKTDLLLQLIVSAKDEATSILGRIGGALADLTRSALGLIFPDFGASVKAAEALEIQMGKLRAGVEATGGAAGLTADDIDEMARRLDEATLGSAAGFRAAATELLTFKSVGKDAFERTLIAAQDLADAGFGTVESAAVQLGKALEDPEKGLTALTRVGVSFTAEQTAMIENFVRLGDTAAAQNVILGAVEGQVQGIASAAGGGLAGALDLVGKRMTDLQETVGGALTPVLTQLNLVWADVIGAVQKAVAEISGKLLGSVEQAGGALKSFGQSIGTFLTTTIRDLGDWISNLDWTAIQDGARQAGTQLSALSQNFVEFSTVTGKIVDGIKIGVNVVQVGFNGLVGGVQILVAGFISGLATVEEAASKVGLGSLERANELRARAEKWKGYAQESLDAVRRDAAEGVEAFQSLTGETDAAAQAQKGLKDSLPVAELQTLTRTLDDYRGIAERANQAAQQAKTDFDAGKISAAEYGAKLLAAAEANTELEQETSKQAEATQASAVATEDSAKAHERLRKVETTLLELAADFRSAQEASAAAATKEAQAAEELARAKGNEQEIREAVLLVQQREVEEAEASNVARHAELQILESQRRQLIETAGGIDKLTAAQRLELATLEQSIIGKNRDIAAGESLIQVQQREADQAERMAGPIGKLIDLYQKKSAATARETDAIERGYTSKIRDLQVEKDQAEAKGDSTRAAELAVEIKQQEAEVAQAVADATRVELQAQIDLIEAKKLAITFEEKLTEAGQERIAQMDEEIAKLRDAIDAEQDKADSAQAAADAEKGVAKSTQESGDAAEKAGEQSQQANAGRLAGLQDVIKGYNGVTQAAIESAIAQDQVFSQQHWANGIAGIVAYGQAINEAREIMVAAFHAEENLNAEIDRLATLAEGTGDAARYAHTQLLQMARNGGEGIKGLTQAGEEARQKLNEIRNAALEAEDALAAMAQDFQKQILQLKGDQRTLLNIENQEQLAQLDAYYAKAGQLGSEEYRRAKDAANQLHQLKLEQLKTEEAAAKTQAQDAGKTSSTSSSSASSSSASAGSANKYQLDLTVGTQILSAFTDVDPKAFLDAIETARRVT